MVANVWTLNCVAATLYGMGRQIFSVKDLIYSVTTGTFTGFIAWRLFGFLGIPQFISLSYAWLVLLVPILWVLGVNLGYFIGRWIPFFNQFGRFAAIGFTNAAVDFGVLNLLIATSGIATGYLFSVFKGISFMVAVTHSYFWNKHWVFHINGAEDDRYKFIKFFSVMLVAITVNVIVASVIVNGFSPMFGFDDNIWANFGAVIGAAAGLAFSFTGFRLIVFKKQSES